MSILINRNTKVLVQGITGNIGTTQTKLMLKEGTKIVSRSYSWKRWRKSGKYSCF